MWYAAGKYLRIEKETSYIQIYGKYYGIIMEKVVILQDSNRREPLSFIPIGILPSQENYDQHF